MKIAHSGRVSFKGNVTQVGRATIVTVKLMVNDREYESAGGSVCDQHDDIDPDLGIRLALGRALVDLGRDVKHEAWKEAMHA